jgi:hypothetical protein
MNRTHVDGATKHRLTILDAETRQGLCSICGPIRLARNGKSWVCSVQKADLRASWYNRNKRKAKPSAHALVEKDPVNRLGICPIDGPVDIVPFARGWACSVRAAELNHHQAEPHAKCSVCGNFDSRHNPVSPTGSQGQLRCEACARLLYQGTEPNVLADTSVIAAAFGSSVGRDGHQGGGHSGAHMVSNFEWLNPEYMPDYESAVPGWKTLGAK